MEEDEVELDDEEEEDIVEPPKKKKKKSQRRWTLLTILVGIIMLGITGGCILIIDKIK
jgi:flagellar basal body-associated protein FliL